MSIAARRIGARWCCTCWESNALPSPRTLLHESVFVSVLTALNVWIAAAVFGLDYHEPLRSIEPACLAIARWMMEHPDSDWAPLWYLGMPIQNAYPPLIPSLTATLSRLAAIEPAAAYHWICGAAYALGPASLYLLGRTTGLSAPGAGLAAAGMSLASPAALLFPSVIGDMGGAEGPRRLDALVRYGEGPQVLTLTLWPLALAAFHRAIERRTPAWVGLAALGAALVALANWLSVFALAIACFSLLLARGWSIPRWRTALGTGALAYALACTWLPLSTIQTIRHNAPRSGGAFAMGAPQWAGWFVLLLLAVGLAWLLHRRSLLPLGTRFALFFTLFLGVPAALMEFAQFHLLPQPHRFHLEVEQGLWLLAGAGAALLIDHFGRRAWVPLAVALAATAVVQVPRYGAVVDAIAKPVAKEDMLPFQVAQALAAHDPNARLFAVGVAETWVNVFSDNPQVGGVFDQGVLWDYFQAYRYGLGYTEGDGERTARWLRVMGADAVFVSEADGLETSRAYWRDPQKFRGVFEEIWRDGGDVLYAVPGAVASLAHPLRWEELVQPPLTNNENELPVAALDAALLDPTRRRFTTRWETPDHLVIEGEILKSDWIFVQIAWHPGWDASQDNLIAAVRSDALGMMVVQPAHDSSRLDLRFKGTTSFYLNDGESLLHHSTRVVAVVIWLAWLGLTAWRRRLLC